MRAVIRYCGEDKNWHILLSQRGTKFSDTEHNQWISRSPLVQAFNLKKNFVTQSLLELKNDIVGMRFKKKKSEIKIIESQGIPAYQ